MRLGAMNGTKVIHNYVNNIELASRGLLNPLKTSTSSKKCIRANADKGPYLLLFQSYRSQQKILRIAQYCKKEALVGSFILCYTEPSYSNENLLFK